MVKMSSLSFYKVKTFLNKSTILCAALVMVFTGKNANWKWMEEVGGETELENNYRDNRCRNWDGFTLHAGGYYTG